MKRSEVSRGDAEAYPHEGSNPDRFAARHDSDEVANILAAQFLRSVSSPTRAVGVVQPGFRARHRGVTVVIAAPGSPAAVVGDTCRYLSWSRWSRLLLMAALVGGPLAGWVMAGKPGVPAVMLLGLTVWLLARRRVRRALSQVGDEPVVVIDVDLPALPRRETWPSLSVRYATAATLLGSAENYYLSSAVTPVEAARLVVAAARIDGLYGSLADPDSGFGLWQELWAVVTREQDDAVPRL